MSSFGGGSGRGFGRAFAAGPSGLYAFTTHTFTNATATGRTGPTLAQCRTAYSAASWAQNNSFFNMTTQGIQEWTVPGNGNYRIEAAGARGGGANGGLGARMQGDFFLEEGQIIRILVGQQGLTDTQINTTGGGGGTYVVKTPYNSNVSILVIAGGGGGSPGTYSSNRNAPTSGNGLNGSGQTESSNGGSNGEGGLSTRRGTAGGGFFTNGQGNAQDQSLYGSGGFSFQNGGLGATMTHTTGVPGSFGGGGHGMTSGWRGSGGGGGYSGGGTGTVTSNADTTSGGGGGSFNNGTNQSNTAGINTGHGYVTITKL
jgi:hypothetical protein